MHANFLAVVVPTMSMSMCMCMCLLAWQAINTTCLSFFGTTLMMGAHRERAATNDAPQFPPQHEPTATPRPRTPPRRGRAHGRAPADLRPGPLPRLFSLPHS